MSTTSACTVKPVLSSTHHYLLIDTRNTNVFNPDMNSELKTKYNGMFFYKEVIVRFNARLCPSLTPNLLLQIINHRNDYSREESSLVHDNWRI